jgi:hypothetical protein
MPTILRFGGLRVAVYPNDHRPAHVHVIGRGHEAVFNLNCVSGPVRLRENYGFSRPALKSMSKILSNNRSELCKAWEEIHGIS